MNLLPDSIIDIIAPAGGQATICEDLPKITAALKNWGYAARFGENIIGEHPLCSNNPALRFADLKEALYNDTSKIIWCYRGGYGCGELIPELMKLTPPKKQKLFVGFSDATFLNIFFNQHWGWQTIHGPGAKQIARNSIDEVSQQQVRQLFSGKLTEFILNDLKPLNASAKKINALSGILTGGNLAIISNTLGTPYQITTKDKILLLEDVNEPAYKIQRMLTHLKHAGILDNLKALVFGSFSEENNALIQQTLNNFAEEQVFPVLQTASIGHGKRNFPVGIGAGIKLIITAP